MKCTEKEPLNRYRHADDVLSALVYYKDVSEPYVTVKKDEQEKTMTAVTAEEKSAAEKEVKAVPLGTRRRKNKSRRRGAEEKTP